MRLGLLLIGLLVFSSSGASLTVIINSADWRDVFSGMHYAALSGARGLYLRRVLHGDQILEKISIFETDILYLESSDTPFSLDFYDKLEERNLNVEKLT